MSKPVAVLISDIHYNLQTLALADAALKQAIGLSNELNVPLIVAGDLHDTKANLRGECVKAMIETFKLANNKPYVMIGNHDLINEKAKDHSLEFLGSYVHLVDGITAPIAGSWLIPYYSDVEELRRQLINIEDLANKGMPRRLIMHQGLNGSDSGDYILDKSALNHEDIKNFRVVSGHYHRRQDIKTGRPRQGAIGMFSYIGNSYTLGFGEANHPEKGFQILMEDGTLEFVPSMLRKHLIITWDVTNDDYTMMGSSSWSEYTAKECICLVKMIGPKEKLALWNKQRIAQRLFNGGDFRLEFIPTDTEVNTDAITKDMSQEAVLDTIIDSLQDSDERKARLKELWRKSASN